MSEKPFDRLTPRVLFLQVKTAQEKFIHIAEKSRTHFQKKESFLIFVEDEQGEQFVDALLWKFPETGFLPHHILSEIGSVPIAITRTKKNLNGAKHAFNLCSTPLLLPGFRLVYEFEDASNSNKQALALMRFTAYKQAGYSLEST